MSKDVIKKVQTQSTKWEKIFINYVEYIKYSYNLTIKRRQIKKWTEGQHRHFSEEDQQNMGQQDMKRCLTL